MGNQVSLVPKVSYEDIQMVVYRNMHVQHSTLIINTLPPSLQHCLIKTTLDIRFEERIVNTFIQNMIMIILYIQIYHLYGIFLYYYHYMIKYLEIIFLEDIWYLILL